MSSKTLWKSMSLLICGKSEEPLTVWCLSMGILPKRTNGDCSNHLRFLNLYCFVILVVNLSTHCLKSCFYASKARLVIWWIR